MRLLTLTAVLSLLLVAAVAAKPAPAAKPAAKAPAAKPAAGLSVGSKAPDFKLTDLNGKSHNLAQYLKAGNVVVLEWFSPQCPFVLKYRADSTYLEDTAKSFKGKKVVWLAVNSSAPTKEGGDPKVMSQFIKDHSMASPVLLDPNGKVGHSYGAGHLVRARPRAEGHESGEGRRTGGIGRQVARNHRI
jgi:peroxiredoxin